MKYAGAVSDINDPRGLGRIRVHLAGTGRGQGQTPWCWPCTPFAGPFSGFYCLPQVGDAVWVERSASGEWVIAGYFWTSNHAKPDQGTATVRVFRTPAGHEMLFDEAGAIELRHKDGSTIRLEPGGKVVVASAGAVVVEGTAVHLGGEDGEAVVLGEQLESFLNDLVQSYNLHTHAAQGSAPPSTITGPSGILSSKVKTE